MAFQLSPSVDFREIDLTGVVPAVSTSIGGYAGSFEWGPCEQIVTISNEKDLVSLFGKPRIVTSVSNFSNQNDFYAAANYLAYASNIKIVRGTSAAHKNASEYKTLVGEYRTSATFVPAVLDSLPVPNGQSYVSYEIDFSNGTVSGTNAEGQFQVHEMTALGGPSVGAPTNGARKRDTITVTPQTSAIKAAVAQEEIIRFEGTVSSSGTVYVQFGQSLTVQAAIPAGSSTSDVATLVASAISSALPAPTSSVGTISAPNAVDMTRVTAGASSNNATGVDTINGRVRRVTVTTSSIPGLSATVEVTKIGTNANTIPVYVSRDGQADKDKSYVLIESGDTAQNVAFKLSNAMKDLSFVYNGADEPVSLVSNTVTWTNSIYGLAPSLDISAISPVDANDSLTVTGLNFAIVNQSPGVDPAPAENWTFQITTDNPSAVGVLPTVSTTVPGGSSNQKFVALVNSAISLAGGLRYDDNTFWTVAVDPNDPSKLTFTAPEKSSNQATLDFVVLDNDGINRPIISDIGFLISQATITAGSNPNSANVTVNGVNVGVQEGDNGSDLALEWKYNVDNAAQPVETFSNLPQNSTNGTGLGGTFDITIESNNTYSGSVVNVGSNYTVGEEVTINGDVVGGENPDNNVTVRVDTVGAAGTVEGVATVAQTGNGDDNATVDITPTGIDYVVVANDDGLGYEVADQLLVSGTAVGGTSPANDILLDVTSVNNTQSFTGQVQDGGISTTTGTGATFNVTRNALGVTGDYAVQVASGGDDYGIGDTIGILGSNLGGVDTTNDVTFNVLSVNSENTFTGIAPTSTSGSGTGGTFIVTSDAGVFETAVVDGSGGDDYAAADTITFDSADVGGAGAATFDVLTVNDTKVYDTDALTLVPTTPGSGTGADFTIQRSGGTYGSPTIVNAGDDYVVGDSIVYDGGDLDGVTSTNDATISVTAVSATQYVLTNLAGDIAGTGLDITVERAGDGTYSVVSVQDGGSGFAASENIVIDGTTLGGATPANDYTLTLDGGFAGGSLTLTDLQSAAESGSGVAGGPISGISPIVTGTAVQTGPILTLGNPSGTAVDTGAITGIDTIAGAPDESGSVAAVSINGTPTLVTIGPIASITVLGTPRSYRPDVIIDTQEPWKVEVRVRGFEGIAPMVGTQSNPSEDFISYGLRIQSYPFVSTPAEYQVQNHLQFESEGDITAYLVKQLGDFNDQNFQPTIVTLTKADGTKASGEVIDWTYDAGEDKTYVTINHNGGVEFSVGLPVLDPKTVQEPTELPDGSLAYVFVNELIKNDEHFDVVKTSLDGGYFYAIYPGAKGNSIGIGLIDATVDLATYESASFGDGTLFSDVFDARPGTSDNSLAINSGFNDELHVVVYDNDGSLTGTKGSVLETFPFLSKNIKGKDSSGRINYYVDVINDSSDYIRIIEGFVGAGNTTVDLTTELDWGDEATPDAGQSYGLMSNGASSKLQGGTDAMLEDNERMAAYDLLGDGETVDVSLLLTGDTSKIVKKYVLDLADTRRDCVSFISPGYTAAVANADVADINEYFNNSTDGFNSSSYAVFDSGFKYQYDRYNNTYFWAPLSSDIAGLCARTDATNDPWWSPAGINRGQIKNVVRLSFNPDKTARDTLYKNRINPVVTFTGQGTLLYGDKTALARPSAFDRINVRRLFITLEKAISTMAKGYLFEFNDIFTRANFVQNVEPFLRDVQSRRGIEDFYVVCDLTNNTPQVINSNSFVGDIYIKPARSINFITLNFVAVNSGVDFEEVINPTGN